MILATHADGPPRSFAVEHAPPAWTPSNRAPLYDASDIVLGREMEPVDAPEPLPPLSPAAVAGIHAELAAMPPEVGRARMAEDLIAIARMRRILEQRRASAMASELQPLDRRDDPPPRLSRISPDLGFGLATATASVGGHWARCVLSVVAWKDEVADVSVVCEAGSFAMGREARLALLGRELGPSFRPRDGEHPGFEIRFQVADAVAHAEASRAMAVGPLRDVDVPQSLAGAYQTLMSSAAHPAVGDSCGFVGGTPNGRIAMDLLVSAGRRDLLGNVLRGPSPEGRVYGALGLLAMPPLDLSDHAAIIALRRETYEASACDGCFLYSAPPAKLVPEPTPAAVTEAAALFDARPTCGPPRRAGTAADIEASVHVRVPGLAPPSLELAPPRPSSGVAFEMRGEVDVARADFLHLYSEHLWGLTGKDELRPEARVFGMRGVTSRRYLQFHGGYPVMISGGDQASITLVACRGRVVSGSANVVAGLDVDVDVRVPAAEARGRAIAHVTRVVDVAPEMLESALRHDSPFVDSESRHLVWRVGVTRREPFQRSEVDVDALTGTVSANEGRSGLSLWKRDRKPRRAR